MSATEIYLVQNGKQPRLIGETRNAFRGAMYVWNDIARRYFGMDSFPMFCEEKMKEVWNADADNGLSEHEIIVLNSTMDTVTCDQSDAERLCAAFDKYAVEHPNSSLGEQSEIIKKFLAGNIAASGVIAWVQTSVSDGWFSSYEEDEEGESARICDLSSAYSVFEGLKD